MFVSLCCFSPGRGSSAGCGRRQSFRHVCPVVVGFPNWEPSAGQNGGGEVGPKLALASLGSWKKQWLWILPNLGLEVSKARPRESLSLTSACISSLGTRWGWGILGFTGHYETVHPKSGSRDSVQTYPAV